MHGPVRGATAGSTGPTSAKALATEALAMMTEALRLIDLSGGGGSADAHLDLAIHRLSEWINEAEPK